MASLAAYSELRWGELAALTIGQVDEAARVITVDRKVVEVGGRLYVEAPKNRKFRRTVYPRLTPGGYLLAERLAARLEEARRAARWCRHGWRATTSELHSSITTYTATPKTPRLSPPNYSPTR